MHRKWAIAGLALAAFTAQLAPTYAASSPDDGAIVATRSHVDSPKTFWENGSFVLKSVIGSRVVPMQDTVNWVGKGYGKTHARQQYQFLMSSDPVLAPLREHGERWYRAPATPQGHDPIWAGYGSDTSIPIEKFRDATYTLDIVGFDGPGRMEMFTYYEGSLNRMLSSHDPGLRSGYLVPGSHTHNETIFSKPGRYVVTYRTVARDKATGEIISSKLTPLLWQVGGARPEETPSASLGDRFNAAPVENRTSYTFTITPHEGSDKDGDDQLTDFVFQAQDPHASGSLAILLDGYHLTEIPVRAGQARWSEFIGSGEGTYQAVFIPETQGNTSSSDSEASSEASLPPGRWASAPLTYTYGNSTVSTQAATESILPPRSTDPAPAFDTSLYTPADMGVKVTSQAIDEDTFVTTVRMADPRARVRITGGYFERESDASAACNVEGSPTSEGVLRFYEERGMCEGYTLRLRITPHPLLNASAATIEGTEPLDSSSRQEARGQLSTWKPQNEEESSPSPEGGNESNSENGTAPSENTTPAPAPTPDSGNTEGSGETHGTEEADGNGETPHLADNPVLLTRGHVDIRAALQGSTLTTFLRDETRQVAKTPVDRTLSSTTLGLDNSALTARPRTGLLASSQADFLPKRFYYSDATWDNTHIWPGWSTEDINEQKMSSIRLNLAPLEVPEGGEYHLFSIDAFTSTLTHIVNSRGATDFEVPANTHQHASWAFTKPGVYRLKVAASGELAGTTIASAPSCLTFLVGREALDRHAAGEIAPCSLAPWTDPRLTLPTPETSDSTQPSSGREPSLILPSTATYTPAEGEQRGEMGRASGESDGTATGTSAGSENTPQKKVDVRKVCRPATITGGSHTIPANTHVHPNWVFTKEGTYKVHITQSATKPDGTKVNAPMVLTFTVGSEGSAEAGHYDIGSSFADSGLVPLIKDPHGKWTRAQSSLSFGLTEAAKAQSPGGLEFIAEAGQPIWMISSSQVKGVPWLGATTMHDSLGGTTEVTWTLTRVDGPGAMAVFTSGNLGSLVGERWFGGVTERCGFVDENGNPVAEDGSPLSGDLAYTGARSQLHLLFAGILLATGSVISVLRRSSRVS